MEIPAHTYPCRPDHKLEVRLDSKRKRKGRDSGWRVVKVRDHARRGSRELHSRQGCYRKERDNRMCERSMLYRRRLAKRGTDIWHCPATIFTVVNGWRTAHCVATLHCLFRRNHCAAIGGVHRESRCQQCRGNWSCKKHRQIQTRRGVTSTSSNCRQHRLMLLYHSLRPRHQCGCAEQKGPFIRAAWRFDVPADPRTVG